eukprot:gene4697-7784_t
MGKTWDEAMNATDYALMMADEHPPQLPAEQPADKAGKWVVGDHVSFRDSGGD